MAQQENTVKTVRLSVAYKNEWGRILWNKEYRIFTVEVEGEGDEWKENAKNLLDEFHGEIHSLSKTLTEQGFNNPIAAEAYEDIYNVQLFMSDDSTTLIMDRGPWDPQQAAMRQMAESILRDTLKEHPELKELLPPQLRHRFNK